MQGKQGARNLWCSVTPGKKLASGWHELFIADRRLDFCCAHTRPNLQRPSMKCRNLFHELTISISLLRSSGARAKNILFLARSVLLLGNAQKAQRQKAQAGSQTDFLLLFRILARKLANTHIYVELFVCCWKDKICIQRIVFFALLKAFLVTRPDKEQDLFERLLFIIYKCASLILMGVINSASVTATIYSKNCF